MSAMRHYAKLVLAGTVVVSTVSLAPSLGQPVPQVDKVSSEPQPPPPDMPPLSPAEVLKRQGRGGSVVYDIRVSRRSDFDKALPNPYAVNQTWFTMPTGRYLGGISGIMVDNDGRSIWIAERCGGANICAGSTVDPVMKFSADGVVATATAMAIRDSIRIRIIECN